MNIASIFLYSALFLFGCAHFTNSYKLDKVNRFDISNIERLNYKNCQYPSDISIKCKNDALHLKYSLDLPSGDYSVSILDIEQCPDGKADYISVFGTDPNTGLPFNREMRTSDKRFTEIEAFIRSLN